MTNGRFNPLSRAPVVDFSKPYNPAEALMAQRKMLQGVANDIQSTMTDVGRFGAEGAYYATIAGAWAATLMVTEICKIGLSAVDRRARFLFTIQDRTIAQADKILKVLKIGKIATKDDVLKSLDPDLRNVAVLADTVKKARGYLKQKGAKETKDVKLVLDLVDSMSTNTLLLMQANRTQQQSLNTAASAQAKMRHELSRVARQIMMIDSRITHMYDRAAIAGRTA